MNEELYILHLVGPVQEVTDFARSITLRENQCRGNADEQSIRSAHELMELEAHRSELEELYRQAQDFSTTETIHDPLFEQWIQQGRPVARPGPTPGTHTPYCLFRFLNSYFPYCKHTESTATQKAKTTRFVQRITHFWSKTEKPEHYYDLRVTDELACLTLHSVWAFDNIEHPFSCFMEMKPCEILANSYVFLQQAYSAQVPSFISYRRPSQKDCEITANIGIYLSVENECSETILTHPFQIMRHFLAENVPQNVVEILFQSTLKEQRPLYIDVLKRQKIENKNRRIWRAQEDTRRAQEQNEHTPLSDLF